MKKLLLLFAMLLTSVGTWAQVITEVGDAFDPTGLTVLSDNNTGYGDHYVMEVVKFKGSDSNTQTNTYLYTEDSSSRIKVGSLPLNDADNYRYIFNIYKMGDSKYKIWVNNQGLPSFANNASGPFNIEATTAAAEQTLIKVQGQENVYMIRGFAGDRAYLMLEDESSQKVVKVTGSVDNAMWVKIHKVTVKSSEIVFDTEKKYYLVESSSNLFVGKDANNKARLYSDFRTANPFKVSIDEETGCHTFQTDDSYLYAGWWEAETSSSKCVWSVEDVDAEGYFTLHFTGDANNSNRQTGFLGRESATNDQQLYSNQTHYQGKIMRFRLVEEDQVQNVTYKFTDDPGNLLATKTLTAIGTYPDASMFLKVPSDVVSLQGVPTGNVNPEKSEYEITVSYNSNFPFVPTTIVDGNFAQGTKWYNMKIRNKKNRMKWVVEQSGETVTKKVKSHADYNNQDDEAQYFAFVGNVFEGFYIYNRSVGADKAMKCTTGGTTFEETDWTCVELFHGNSNGYWQFAPVGRSQTNGRIHDFQPDLKLWDNGGASGDAGSNITIFEVDIDGGKVVANFQFKHDGEVKYTERKEYYAGYDITLNPPYGISHNIEKMPKEGGDIEVPWTYTGTFNYYPSFNEITKWYYLKLNSRYVYHQEEQEYYTLVGDTPDLEHLEAHAWAFVGNPFDGYRIYNRVIGAGKILSSSTAMADGKSGGKTHPIMTEIPVPEGNNELWYATASSHATNGFFLEQKGYPSQRMNDRSDVYKNDKNEAIHSLSFWTDGYGSGSTFVVEDAIPVRLTTDDKNPICYALKTGRDWDSKEWWYNYDSSDGKISLTQFDGSDVQWWYFKGTLIDKKVHVQLVPKADPTKVMSYAGSGNGAEKIEAKSVPTDGYTNTWRFAFKGGRYVLQTSDGSNYLSNNGGRNNGYINKMGLWSGSPESDSGTALYIYETMPFELRDNAGNEYAGTFLYQLESLANPTFTGSHALALSNIERGETFTADVDFGFPVSKLDGTADFSVLISGWRGTRDEGYFKYYVDGSNVKVTSVSPTSANVRNFEWSIYPHLAASDFTFTIKNIGTGKYIQTSATEEAIGEGTVVVGNEATATSFIWEANNRFKIVDQELRLSVSSSKIENNIQDLGVDEGHGGCNTYITNTSSYVDNLKSQYEGFFGYVGGYSLDEGEKFNAIDTYVKYLEYIETPKETLKLESGEVFKIICKDSSRGSMVYSTVEGKGSEENVFLAGTSGYSTFPSIDAEGVYDKWAYVTIEGKDYLFNVHKKQFISPQGEVVKFADNGSAFVLEAIQGPLWAVKFTDSGNSYLCLAPGHGALPVRAIGNIADDGNRFYLQKTSETIDHVDLLSMKELHFAGKLNAWKAQNIALLGYVGAYPTKLHDDINAVYSYNDIDDFEKQHTTDIIPLTEGYYYIKGTGVEGGMSNYVNLKDQNSKKALWTETQNEADLSADNIFRFVAAGENKYKIQSYSNGKYLQLKEAANNADNNSYLDYTYNDGEAFTFTDMGIAKHKIADGNGDVMRTEGGSAQINSWSDETTETWYLIQAPELPLTIHSTGYSTFSAAVDVEVPEGVTAYYAKEQVGGSHIRMYPITTIPANEGVVIKGTGSVEVKFPIIADAAELPADVENLLKAHLNTEAVTPANGNSVFVMATRNEVTGFYPLSTTNNTIGGHKSYLEIPSNPAARLSIIWDDTETGIFETEGGEQNAEIYDLTGRRLDKPTKGVNVVGGKLVIN